MYYVIFWKKGTYTTVGANNRKEAAKLVNSPHSPFRISTNDASVEDLKKIT